jgi:hypothetical protein
LKRTVRTLLPVAIAPVAVALLVTAAAAQYYPPDVVERCARVGEMPGTTCTTCDNFRDYYEHACEANGGEIPGASTMYHNPSDR